MADTLAEQVYRYIRDLSALKISDGCLDAAVTNPAVACDSVSFINNADAPLFDAARYAESNSVDACPPLSFFVKEAAFISRMGNLQDPQKRQELNIKIYELLRVEVEKMIDFMTFRDAAVVLVTDVFAGMEFEMGSYEVAPSSAFFELLAETLDMFVVMDAMKNIKGSMNNDFSLFKRTMPSLPKEYFVEDQTVQYHRLYLFLGQQDQFATELKKSLQEKCKHADDILTGFLAFGAEFLEKRSFQLPTARHVLVRSLAFGIYLLDEMGEEKDINKRKRLKLERFGKIFRATPVVPLLGDMPLLVSNVFGKAKNLNAAKWDVSGDTDARDALKKSFGLVDQIEELRDRFCWCLSELTQYSASADSTQYKQKETSGQEPEFYNCVLESLKVLSLLSRSILEQSGWKFWNPTSHSINPNVPESASAYELAVKYNYSDADKAALIEAISMVKVLSFSLTSLNQKSLQMLSSQTKRIIQTFISNNVSDYVSYTTKKKKGLASVFKAVRTFGLELDDVPEKTGKGAKNSDGGGNSFPSASFAKITTFSSTQMHFISVLLEHAISEKSKGFRAGILRDKDLKDAHVGEITAFLETVENFRYVLDLQKTVAQCNDLSSLWFKEFYLELSRQVQFPISMSLPWILTEHILKSNDPSLIRCLFYPFELYNDAGMFALTSLKSRYIYDEITAEVNLCFDQLIFKIGERIFSHFKRIASYSVLSPDFSNEVDFSNSAGVHYEPLLDLYDFVTGQRNLNLLGRSIDVSFLLCQMINQYVRKSLDVAISRFEGSDLSYIMELDCLIKSLKKSHELMSKRLKLDCFDDIFAEVNESLSLTQKHGRILTHICSELINDVVPNFCYETSTNRFVRSSISFIEPVARSGFAKAPTMYLYGSKSLSVAFITQNCVFRDFIGDPHFQTILRLCGHQSLRIISGEISKHLNMLGTPQSLRLPLFEYGTEGTYEYFLAHLKPLVSYRDLQGEVLQAFREVGNAILTMRSLSEALKMQLMWTQMHVGTLPNISADPKKLPKTWEEKAGADHKQASDIASSLIRDFLTQLSVSLEQVSDDWKENETRSLMQNPRAFYRIWSAVQFAFTVPALPKADSSEKNNLEIFGDGLCWGGGTFISLLGQVGLFSAFDFNQHIVSVFRSEKKAGGLGGSQPDLSDSNSTIAGSASSINMGSTGSLASANVRPDIASFLESARTIQTLYDEIFGFMACVP
ncbi:Cytoplasmic FMR1-interacting protein 2 [Dinochytrium kinnereticum]|nr:Cytoplasmic FMR1-interacting protein 2 [Dinochytrium kinnereticum]